MTNVTESFHNATAGVKSWCPYCHFLEGYEIDPCLESRARIEAAGGASEDGSDIDTISDAAAQIAHMLGSVMWDVVSNGPYWDDTITDYTPRGYFRFALGCIPFADSVRLGKADCEDLISNQLCRVWDFCGDGWPHRDIITMLARGFDYTGKRGDSTLSADDFRKASLVALGLVRVPLS